MNEFQSIMQLMNNGVYNDSTLKDSVPAIVKFSLKFGQDKANEALEWVPEEQALQNKKGHEGLDQIVGACKQAITYQMEQSKVR